MAINNKSYLTKAFIFLFSLITEIYNVLNKLLRNLWITVTLWITLWIINCNFVCQQTKLGDTEIILKKVDKVCRSSHTLSFVENIAQLYTHKPLKTKLKSRIIPQLFKWTSLPHSNKCIYTNTCIKKTKTLFLQIPRIVVSYLVPIPTPKKKP